MNKHPKVLFVVEYYYPHIGGVELLFQSIAENLAQKGYQVGVVTMRVNQTKAKEVINGVNVYRTWVPKRASRYFFTFFGLFSVLPIAWKYDIIHTTTYNAAVPGSIAGLLLRKKVILTVHEVWVNFWSKLPGIGNLTKSVLCLFEKVILGMPYAKFVSVSKATQKSLLEYRPSLKSKSVVIYNGIDYASLPPKQQKDKSTHQRKTLLYFGRPGISKGVEKLIEAANNCTNPNLKFRLVVSKDEDARYNLISGLITNPAISIEPSLKRDKLFQAMQDADYAIIPSLNEGFGFAALEASIYSKKLISSNQGALPEVVFGNVLFYSPWNHADLTNIFNTLEKQKFQTIPEKKFPIAKTAEAYTKLY